MCVPTHVVLDLCNQRYSSQVLSGKWDYFPFTEQIYGSQLDLVIALTSCKFDIDDIIRTLFPYSAKNRIWFNCEIHASNLMLLRQSLPWSRLNCPCPPLRTTLFKIYLPTVARLLPSCLHDAVFWHDYAVDDQWREKKFHSMRMDVGSERWRIGYLKKEKLRETNMTTRLQTHENFLQPFKEKKIKHWLNWFLSQPEIWSESFQCCGLILECRAWKSGMLVRIRINSILRTFSEALDSFVMSDNGCNSAWTSVSLCILKDGISALKNFGLREQAGISLNKINFSW